jgi:predicted PurR-regulated permease PerM
VRKETVNAAFFFIVLTALAVLGLLVLLPILDFLLLGLLLALGFYPMHAYVLRAVRFPRLAALVTLSIAAVIAVVPLVIVVVSLLGDIRGLFARFDPGAIAGLIYRLLGDGPLAAQVAEAVEPHFSAFVASLVADLARIVARMVIGLLVMGFVMYYAFVQGPAFVAAIQRSLPLKEVYKERLIRETRSLVEAMFFGQLLVGLAHGAVIAVGFLVFGLPNPFIWGVVTVIVSIAPAIGTPAVYLPAAVYLFLTAGTLPAVLFALFGVIFSTLLVEYWLRLRLLDRMARVHPLVVVLGVVGGIGVFGVSGFIFGPLILTLLLVTTRVFSNTYREDENYVFL